MQTDAEFVAFWRAMALREQRDRLPQGPSPAEIQRSWAAAPTPAWGTTAPVDDSGMLAGLERAQATVDRHRLKHGENYRSRMGDSSGIEGIHPYLTDDIDIYLSVGTADEKGNNCKMGADGVNNRTCEIYRLRGRLSNIQAACVTRVTRMGENNGHPVGAIQPAVSPSGDRMAYMEDGKSTNRLVVQDLRGCVPYNINDRGQWSHAEGCAEYMTCYSSVVDSEEHHLENYLEDYLEEDEEDEEWKAPNFPNWYLDDWLLFTKGAGERSGHSDKTLHMAEVAGYPVRVEGSFPVAGPNGAFSQNRTFQDANTARDGSNRVVTFGQTHQNGTSSGPLEPAVHNVFGLWPGNGGGSLDPQSFHLGMQVSDRTKPVKECHHPAFSPSGKSVGCSEQQNVEFIGNSQFRFIY
ncbi:MAG TPA: hypothetical protein PLA94_30280, partial [Myxococcota bacterium]|nr:hypothetical protein [Myxococcota bacterium]